MRGTIDTCSRWSRTCSKANRAATTSASSTQYPTWALWNAPRTTFDRFISPTRASPTNTPKPQPVPSWHSRRRAPQRMANAWRSSTGSGLPAVRRGSQLVSQPTLPRRTACHTSKSAVSRGRSMTRRPCSTGKSTGPDIRPLSPSRPATATPSQEGSQTRISSSAPSSRVTLRWRAVWPMQPIHQSWPATGPCPPPTSMS